MSANLYQWSLALLVRLYLEEAIKVVRLIASIMQDHRFHYIVEEQHS